MKLAIICGGRSYKKSSTESKQLRYIDDSVNEVTKTLDHNGWICKPVRLQTTKEYTDLLVNYKNKRIDEFLFYFTGHGFGSNSVTFEIYLGENELTIEQLLQATKKGLGRSPSKIGLIIDSCYSGKALEYSDEYVEILTSTDGDTESFEKTSLGMSVFSHYFCDVFQTPQELETINFACVKKHLLNNQEKQKPFYSEAQNKKSITLGVIKEVNEIRESLKQKFETHQKFKDKVVEYLAKDDLGFKEILATQSFDETVKLLLHYKKECLYCLFKELEIENAYINNFKTDQCEAFKIEAANSREVIKVILRIYQSSSLKECLAEGWLQYDIDTIESLDNIEIDFEADYIKTLSTYLTNALDGRIKKAPLDLDLILDDGLFTKGFQALAERNNLNITTQFLTRNRDFFKRNKSSVWKTNSEFYQTRKEEPISNYIFSIDEIYNKNSLRVCTTAEKIVVVSAYNLLTPQYLEMIIDSGLPFIISPCSDIETKIEFQWKNATMDTLRSKAILVLTHHYNRVDYYEKKGRPLNEEKNIQFIYDNYYDAAKFKQLINETEEKIQG
jgi:hypothetical protein